MIKLEDINISFERDIIKNGSVSFYPNAVNLISGPSGSGKSSLLYKVGLISNINDLHYSIDNKEYEKLEDISNLRRFTIGYVLQDQCLFDQYDIVGNMSLYAAITNMEYSDKEYRDILKLVALDKPLHDSVATLSGGEKQRLQIACALCKKPDILILDEPTNALDQKNERLIFSLLQEYAHHYGCCVIIASHSYYANEYCDYHFKIENQSIVPVHKEGIETNHTLQQRNGKLRNKFYIRYIRYFLKKYRDINILMLVVLAILSIASYTVNIVVEDKINTAINEIEASSDNQVLVMNDKYDRYISDMDSAISLDAFNTIIDQYQTSYYPYYPLEGIINETQVLILPYYDENSFDDEILCHLGNQENGIYLSYPLYKSIVANSYNMNELSVYIEATLNNEMKVTEESMHLSGALLENVYSSFQPNEMNYIYVHQDVLSELYDTLGITQEDMMAYVVFISSFDEYQSIVGELEGLEIGVNSDFSDIDGLNETIEHTTSLQIVTHIILFIVFFVLLCAMQLNYFYKRKKEFAILLINGLSHKEIVKLILSELIIKLLSIFLLVVAIPMILFLGINMIEVTILLQSYMFISLYYVFAVVVIFIISSIVLKKVYPDQIIRD